MEKRGLTLDEADSRLPIARGPWGPKDRAQTRERETIPRISPLEGGVQPSGRPPVRVHRPTLPVHAMADREGVQR